MTPSVCQATSLAPFHGQDLLWFVRIRNKLGRFKDRLKALEEKMAKENLILTESQIQVLERKKQDDIAAGEIETAHPGYLGSQDTFYVGTLKGVGRIYQ